MEQQIFQNDVTWNIVNSLLLKHARNFSYLKDTFIHVSDTCVCVYNIKKNQNDDFYLISNFFIY
jgi:hypothetical protein